MHLVLLGIIRLYWLIPPKWRRRCIFKVSCSHYVYDQTKKNGLTGGISSLKQRMKQCKPGYGIYISDDGMEWVILHDCSMIKRELTNV